MKHTIWTNNIDYSDWKEDLEAQYPDAEGYDEEKRKQLMYEINNEYLEDEIVTLDKELGNKIVVIGDLGLWHGRLTGYNFLGTNLNSIFTGVCGDYVEWYIQNEDVKCLDIHHDGTNHYTYRLLKDIDQHEFEEFAWEHSIQEAVEKYTEPIGHYVAEIYGIEVPK